MHYTKKADETPVQENKNSIEEIVNRTLLWDDPQNIREDLHEMMLSFFMLHDCIEEKFKDRIFCTYSAIYNTLKEIEALKEGREEG